MLNHVALIILPKWLNVAAWKLLVIVKWIPAFWFVCLFGFYGISMFVGYLMPNPFLYKETVLFQAIQFSISTQFNLVRYRW